MKQFFLIYGFLLVLVVTGMGFRGCRSERTPWEIFPDMDRQQKLHPQGVTPFFADDRSDRPPPAGSVPTVTYNVEPFPHLVPWERPVGEPYLMSGLNPEGGFGDGIPIDLTAANMARGQELFNTFCAICHGAVGDGAGTLAAERFGYTTIASLLQTRIINLPDGDIFNTITHGKNTMGPYGSKIRPEDRWKVVLYVRALQRAATATEADVPAQHRRELGL